ncbi:cellulose-binding domain-containing protein, partial [Micromonospora endophytica]
GNCQVTYAVSGQWSGGFQGDVTIRNTGTSAINGWTLRWSFANGQQLNQAWNTSYTQSGTQVTATNVAYNGAISPGASVSFGFIASWTGSNTTPTAFTLNGSPCALG